MLKQVIEEILRSEEILPNIAIRLYMEGVPIQFSDDENSGKWYDLSDSCYLSCLTKRKLRIAPTTKEIKASFHKMFWDILA